MSERIRPQITLRTIDQNEALRLRARDRVRRRVPRRARDPRVGTRGLVIGGGVGGRLPRVAEGAPGAPLPSVAPDASYQWLLFDVFDGSVPAGAFEFVVQGPPIPFVGAITEVDVVASDPGDDWQMLVGVAGVGSIFRTTQPTDKLAGDGYFRPTPPGFWPETEGLTFPLPAPGLVPEVRVRRSSGIAANLTLRVLIVAHPSF